MTNDAVSGGYIRISGDDYHHAVRVLRVREGERLTVSDESGHDYLAEVVSPSAPASHDQHYPAGDTLLLRVLSEYGEGHELPARVTLFQCVIKGERMEWVIEKAVELGVTRIVPVLSRYSVVRLEGERAAARTRRYQKIARSAAGQSRRGIVPEVLAPVGFEEAIAMMDECDLRFIPYECEQGMESADTAARAILARTAAPCCTAAPAEASPLAGSAPAPSSIGVIIGPEGGFHPEEIALAAEHAVTPVSLGTRILRADTAALTSLSALMLLLELGQIGKKP